MVGVGKKSGRDACPHASAGRACGGLRTVRPTLWIIGAVLLAMNLHAVAAQITIFEPVLGKTGYRLNYIFENDDVGIYNSATFSTIQILAQQLFESGNRSSSNINDLADSELIPSILPPPNGDIFVGWGFSAQNDGELSFTKIAPFGTTAWDTKKLALTTVVDFTLLELNGIAGHQAIGLADMVDGSFTNRDATVVRSDDPLSEAEKTGTFTGFEGGANGLEFTATGLNYVLVLPSDLAPHPVSSISTTNGFELTWYSVSGATYQAEFTTSLSNGWNYLGGPVLATNGFQSLEIAATNEAAFFWVWFAE